jgi:DNA topoisomerase-1
MRTDSTTLSTLALTAAEQHIKTSYGDTYYKHRQFKTKNQSAQEAHEAIRPTEFVHTSSGDDESQKKLYRLIWQRTLASQMSEARLELTEATISISSDASKTFAAKGEILQFDGFMKVYGGTKDDTLLPPLSSGQQLEADQITAAEIFSRPPARYSEAALVRKLEELGIGRPSTYAPTISTIQTRGYVEKTDLEGVERTSQQLILRAGTVTQESSVAITGADRSKLVPTSIAEVTTDFLVKYFPSIVNYDFTASVEEDFDKIAQGKKEWTTTIADFYKDFHPLVEQSAEVSRQEVSQARLIGTEPKSGEPIYARFGRYGPMLQQGETDEEDKKPLFAPMPTNTTIDTVTLEQALVMFELPRTVGTTAEGDEIKANIGRFGPYVQIGKVYVSIKPLDPHTITEAEARELYTEKLAKDVAKHIKSFDSGIRIQNGPYGPYVTDGKKNARIPKSQDPEAMTEAEAKTMLDAAPAKKRSFKKRAPKK